MTVPAESNEYVNVYLQERSQFQEDIAIPRIPVPIGKMIGGSEGLEVTSGVNYTVYVRPPRLLQDDSYAYDKFVGSTQSPQQRGESGLITVTQISGAGLEFSEWLKDLGDKTDSRLLIDYNAGTDLVTTLFLQGPSSTLAQNVPVMYNAFECGYHDIHNRPVTIPTVIRQWWSKYQDFI